MKIRTYDQKNTAVAASKYVDFFTELSKMLLNKQTPEETVRSIARKSNEALGKKE
ncbi:hypothetical protein GCM10020331_097870 [Ectobacillus funiculus]